jgi:Subtilase family
MSRLKVAAAVVAAAILAGAGLAAPPAPAWAPPGDTAIVVIDNFALRPTLPQHASPSANCPYTRDDTNVVGDSGAGDDLPDTVSHGKAVQSLLSNGLDGAPGIQRLADASDLRPYGLDGMAGISSQVERWKVDGTQELILIGMQTNGFTTTDLANRLGELVARLSLREITRVVLNMSFIIAPCNVPAWLKTLDLFDGPRTLAAYHTLIDAHPELEALRQELGQDAEARILSPLPGDPLTPLRMWLAPGEFYGLANPAVPPLPGDPVRTRLDADPLKERLTGLAGSGTVVPVGAAGNGVLSYDSTPPVRTRFAFPFAPALWDPVLSVGAATDAGTRAEYSNNGEVLMPGITMVERLDETWATVHGSSFAAPRLSSILALHLLRGGPSPCNGHTPIMGYTNSDLDGQHWDDMEWHAASKEYCPGDGP